VDATFPEEEVALEGVDELGNVIEYDGGGLAGIAHDASAFDDEGEFGE